MKKSFDEGGQFAWDATSLTVASECLRKYYYTLILDLEPVEKSVHLLFGGLYASALEQYYHLRADGKSLDDALAEVIHKTLIDAEGKEFLSNSKTLPNLLRSIIWYVDEFDQVERDTEVETYHLADGKPAVELSFSFELTDDLLYCGHLDRVAKMGEDLYILDQKTSGSTLTDYYFRQFKPSMQMMGYTWAGRILLKTPVRGVIIDAAHIKVGGTEYQRRLVQYTEEQLTEWVESVLHTAYLAREAYQANKWPQNFSACGNYGGCPFRTLCAAPASLRKNFIKGSFQQRTDPWDPLVPR